ncbi:MAG: hypothetical protein OQK54_01025 [Gammaproteobacteria bacterium]|nr:hypothetical protein [Gammaproteobacteria bacterium]
MKLTQKHLFKGTQEFEIIDDHVKVRIKAPFKDEESLTVMLTVLNSEPVITRSSLDFTSRVNGEALLSLSLGKPNAEAFNAFVSALKNKAQNEYQAFAGLKHTSPPAALGDNVFDEPPLFDDDEQEPAAKVGKALDPSRIEESVQMLRTYLNSDDIAPFMAALEKLGSDPNNEALQVEVLHAFRDLGPTQGAVLTYAPYVGILMSDGPAGSPY